MKLTILKHSLLNQYNLVALEETEATEEIPAQKITVITNEETANQVINNFESTIQNALSGGALEFNYIEGFAKDPNSLGIVSITNPPGNNDLKTIYQAINEATQSTIPTEP